MTMTSTTAIFMLLKTGEIIPVKHVRKHENLSPEIQVAKIS